MAGLQALLKVTMRKLEFASEAAQRSSQAGEEMHAQLKRATANEAAAVGAAHQAASMVSAPSPTAEVWIPCN